VVLQQITTGVRTSGHMRLAPRLVVRDSTAKAAGVATSAPKAQPTSGR
jgi:hypothetical protein